jgi:hypothetical protein
MEQCGQHKEHEDKMLKILEVLDEIKAVIIGDIKNPKNIGLISRIATLEVEVKLLKDAKNNIVNIALKILAGLAVSGISIKTVLDALN